MRSQFILCWIFLSIPLAAQTLVLREGATMPIGARTATIQHCRTLPYVESDYTRRFHFDSAENPKLRQLRDQYHFEAIIAPGKDEFETQIFLNDWVHRRFKKFGHPSSAARGGLQILAGIQRGDAFFCAQYAELLVSAAASLGWNDRLLALRRHQGVNEHGGSTEHTSTEIWSNEHAKWVMLDPTSNMYLEHDGIPLNAWEIRQEWFYHAGTNLTFVVGREKVRYRKKDLPILLERFADFGDLTIDPDELDKYGFIGYIPNTNVMDAGNDYAQMFIVKDQLCAGTKWHERVLPEHPESDPYFPLNQSALEFSKIAGDKIEVRLQTFTPNFRTFEHRLDAEDWHSCAGRFEWPLHSGGNELHVRTVNQFGIFGPESIVELNLR